MSRGRQGSAVRWRATPWACALALVLVVGMPAAAQGQAPAWGDDDWAVFEGKVRWALQARVDTLSMGSAMAALGRTFVGTPYVPNTLEAPGVEGLVINFRGLDCVTFVENVFALARFARSADAATLLDHRQAAETRYSGLLMQVRYRGGRMDGYPSRLHYFSDWIADGAEKGLVDDVTRELGGVHDGEPVHFMSRHPEAYRQLGENPMHLAAIRAVEERLAAAGRWYIPEAKVAEVATGIRDGDIIALTSTVGGMDVAHTGLAVWVDGTLRLMHAPLVGDSVEVSAEPLAQRVLRIRSQDGIMVARPRDTAR